MLTVHVWPGSGVLGSGGNVGHGAMTCGTTYISWWPESGSVGVGSSLYQMLRGEDPVPGAPEIFSTDYLSEGSRFPVDFAFTDVFDEDAILDAWAAWQSIGTYSLTYRSCCACVATMLIAGGLSRVVPNYSRYFTSAAHGRVVVTPDDLRTVARAVRTSLTPERSLSMAGAGRRH